MREEDARPDPPTEALLVGAFEPDAWAGLVLALPGGGGVSLRLSAGIDGARVEPADWFWLVHEVGPHAPDGTNARLALDLTLPLPATRDTPIRKVVDGEASLAWEWARVGPLGVVARARSARALQLEIVGRRRWGWPAGDAQKERFPLVVYHGSAVVFVADAAAARLTIDLAAGDDVLLFARCDREAPFHDRATGSGVPIRRCLERHLADAAAAYERSRVSVTGDWDGLAASITNNLHWMILLQPEHGRRYVPAGRRWIFPDPRGDRDDWTIFAWDGFFNALQLSLESSALARDMVDAVLGTQYPTGNVPNWRGRHAGTPDRSQPPVGAFTVLSIARRCGDPAFARRALPPLDAWHAWWTAPVQGRPRRQRPSGLFAWGSDLDLVAAWVPAWEQGASHRQKAAWESGQDDLPNWDDAPWDAERSTLALECVDLSALMALDAECLAELHAWVGEPAPARAYRDEHARLAGLINDRLWDEARGVYADRQADGSLSPRLAASNFLPLLAGVVRPDRLERTLQVLLDPARFWGEWIVPTVARDDPAFADQQYWRGTIWSPINFLLYQALRRARADASAATLAARSAALFLHDWRAHQMCRENFSSVDGTGGGQRHQSWGPLFAWTALCEFADVTPWDGLRIGTTTVGTASEVERLRLAGHEWRIALAPDAMAVTCDGRPWFLASGPVCLRHVQPTASGWMAEAHARREIRLRLPTGVELTVPPGVARLDVG